MDTQAFTTDNTEGYSATQLADMNLWYDEAIAAFDDPKQLKEAIFAIVDNGLCVENDTQHSDLARNYDDETREYLHSIIAPCSAGSFWAAYVAQVGLTSAKDVIGDVQMSEHYEVYNAKSRQILGEYLALNEDAAIEAMMADAGDDGVAGPDIMARDCRRD